jgi:hypothetical protein
VDYEIRDLASSHWPKGISYHNRSKGSEVRWHRHHESEAGALAQTRRRSSEARRTYRRTRNRKVNYELDSPFEGMLLKIMAPEADDVPVRDPLCQIDHEAKTFRKQ